MAAPDGGSCRSRPSGSASRSTLGPGLTPLGERNDGKCLAITHSAREAVESLVPLVSTCAVGGELLG